MKRILINATQQEELRVAIVDGQKLYNLDIEVPSKEQKKSSVFKGKITRVEPSLEACFVEYGSERHGFLPFKEIARSYWSEAALKSDKRPSIKDAVKSGQEVIVQVEKEERGNKGAALSTKISLAGRYSVLMPTEAKAGGVSRRIEGEDRAQVREAFGQVKKPDNMGAIVRTAGVGRSSEELQWDLDYLVTLWEAIEKAAKEKPAPFLIYHDSSVIIRALRDHYDRDISQILIDSPEIYKQAEDFVRQVMPHNLRKLKLYEDSTPLFSRFQIESQIESAFQREVALPSGGAIVIDPTEALTSIDINSGRATKGTDIEDTAFNTNLEAADEVARQLRLRDLGGLFVIDFIDMLSNKHQREVENRLRNALKVDRARVRTSRISRFGLLELSRQRLRPSLGESSQEVCRVCSGQGTVRSAESLSLSILRLLGEEAAKDYTGTVVAHLPVDVATFLLNEKRSDIAVLESTQKIRIVLVPDSNYERPHYKLERLKDSERDHAAVNTVSYDLPESKEPELVATTENKPAPLSQQAAVQSIQVEAAPTPQAPVASVPAKAIEQPGLFVRMWKGLFGTGTVEEEPSKGKEKKPAQNTQQQRSGGRNSNNRRTRGRGQQNSNRGQQGNRNQQKNTRGQQNNRNQQKNQQTSNRGQKPAAKQSGQKQPQKANPSQEAQKADAKNPEQTAGGKKTQDNQSPQKKTGGRSRRRPNRRRGPRGNRNPNPKGQESQNQQGAGQKSQNAENKSAQGQSTQNKSEANGNKKSSSSPDSKSDVNGNVKSAKTSNAGEKQQPSSSSPAKGVAKPKQPKKAVESKEPKATPEKKTAEPSSNKAPKPAAEKAAKPVIEKVTKSPVDTVSKPKPEKAAKPAVDKAPKSTNSESKSESKPKPASSSEG